MARPEKFEDLSEWDKQGDTVCKLEFSTKLPGDVLVAMGNLAKALKDNGFEVDDNDSFRWVLTDEDKQKALKSAQDNWDYKQENYQKVMSGADILSSSVTLARYFAQEEGLELPEAGA